MRIVIFGSRGLIGTSLVASLVERRFEVFPIVIKSESKDDFPYQLNKLKASQIERTISDINPHVVINLAWITSGHNYTSNHLNIVFAEFSRFLFETCINLGVNHYIFMGSSAEYGLKPGLCDERRTPLAPYDLYSESKVKVFEHHFSLDRNGTELTWLRLFQLFSLKQHRDKLFPEVVNAVKSSSSLEIKGALSTLDWINLECVMAVIVEIIQNKIVGVFNLGTGVATTVRDVVNEVTLALSPRKPPMFYFDSVSSISRIAASNSFLLREGILKCDPVSESIRREFHA